MSIDAYQLRHEIIRPVLKHLEPEIPYSMAAENLLMGTCAQESRMGQWIVQLDDGPARGIFQMEPATYRDLFDNYIDYRVDLNAKIAEFMMMDVWEPEQMLAGNLLFAAAMCRVHYYRQPDALPDANDVYELAKYWKRAYNTNLGKGKVSEFVKNYELLVA